MTDADHFSLDVHLQDHRAPNNSPKKREAMGQIFLCILETHEVLIICFYSNNGNPSKKIDSSLGILTSAMSVETFVCLDSFWVSAKRPKQTEDTDCVGFGGSLPCNLFIEKDFVFHGWPDLALWCCLLLLLFCVSL